jgi:putative membrane protein
VTHIPKSVLVVLFGGALAASVAVAQNSQSSDTSTSSKSSAGTSAADMTFIKKAASGGMAEVELGQLAQQKASNPDVKKFGERMVTDHSKANEQLKAVAQAEHIDLPQHLDAKDQATKDKLDKLSGEQFDRAYMQDMVKDHKTDVAEFQHESKMAKNAEVKNFAAETLPVLQSHLREAESIAPMIEKGTSANAKHGQGQ